MNISLSTRAALLSSTAMMLLAGSAMAADLTRIAPPPPVFTWTGFYVGANAGWVGLDSKATDVDGLYVAKGDTATVDPDGGIFGVQAGYNQQFGSLVAGIEADIDTADAQATNLVWAGEARFSANLDSLATARVRLGFLPTENLLLYVTGGYAGGQIKNAIYDIPFPANSISNSGWRDGWTIGGGGEWALNNQWSVKAEALYVSFGDRSVAVTSGKNTFHFKLQNSAVVARAGLNFHF